MQRIRLGVRLYYGKLRGSWSVLNDRLSTALGENLPTIAIPKISSRGMVAVHIGLVASSAERFRVSYLCPKFDAGVGRLAFFTRSQLEFAMQIEIAHRS